MLHLIYAAVTRWRRRYTEPRRLSRPVISIGNIAAGGRAKTPLTERVTRVLLAAGERPAILSRGYARERAHDEPVIVRDAQTVRASLADSGDEPLMLAERLDGAIVVVGADRGRAGVVAESLGATVHVLDDGFQHLRLARDIDIVVVEPRDLDDEVFPSGRLREPIDALTHVDAVVVLDEPEPGNRVYSTGKNFRVRRRVAPPADAAQGFLVSGIADHGQMANAVRAAGWLVAGEASFKDHHRYTAADARAIEEKARAAGAVFVLTTAKDAVRLRPVWTSTLPLRVAELALEFDESEEFDRWLIERLRGARRAS